MGHNEVVNVKVIWESNIVLGAECREGQCEFEIRISMWVIVRLRLYIRLRLWLWLELINTTQKVIINPDP